MTKIAIAGKGGTGKTTLAGTIARLIAREAIDADSNPNLAVTLGLTETETAELLPIPRTILEESKSARAVCEELGARAPDDVRLLVMGRVDHAGAG